MSRLKQDDSERFHSLNKLLKEESLEFISSIFKGSSLPERRKQLARDIGNQVDSVAPSRLMSLLSQALKWQRHVGLLPKFGRFNILKNALDSSNDLNDQVISKSDRTVKFGKKTEADCIAFSHDGQFLLSGSSDGFIEVWDFETGQIRKDLSYQANDLLMMHNDAVLSLDFSRDGEFVASGSSNGEVKVWRISTGKCIKRFKNCHSSGVGSICFSASGLELLTCGTGATEDVFKLQGLVSGRALREFRGHQSHCFMALFCKDDRLIISASPDGEIKVWDASTAECISTFRQPGGVVNIIVYSHLQKSPSGHGDSFLVVSQDYKVGEWTYSGKLLFDIEILKQLDGSVSKSELVCAVLSSRAKFLYCGSENGIVYCVELATRKVVKALRVHDSVLKGFAHHPQRNILATISTDRTMKLWNAN